MALVLAIGLGGASASRWLAQDIAAGAHAEANAPVTTPATTRATTPATTPPQAVAAIAAIRATPRSRAL
ncbi:MAG: hypothetical protein KF863_21050 [Rubrivivax sp.]|nr:hypothetical protein [Rubrivivax sp.]